MRSTLRCIISAVAFMFLIAEDAMPGPNEDDNLNMMLLKAAGAELASRPVALAMAEMIFKKFYGEDEYKTQLPLKVRDGGNRWIIEGSRRVQDYPVAADGYAFGRAWIVILKANCQVVEFSQKAYMSPPKK